VVQEHVRKQGHALELNTRGLREVAAAVLRVLRGIFSTTVVIKGFHTPEWERALGPESSLWSQIRSVRRVVCERIGEDVIQQRRMGRVVVIPLMECDIVACNAKHEMAVPPAATVEILRNKAAFAHYLKAHQLSRFAPLVYERIEDVQYPFVLKRVDLNGSRGVQLIHSRAEYEQLRKQEPWLGHSYLLQEFIPGCVEHTMNAFFYNGSIVWAAAFSFVLNQEGIKPVGYPATPHEPGPEERECIERSLQPLEYIGPVNIDYKIRPDGRPAILEINPRFGGSLMKPHNREHLAQMVRMILRYAR
jgi:hypothetical protein